MLGCKVCLCVIQNSFGDAGLFLSYGALAGALIMMDAEDGSTLGDEDAADNGSTVSMTESLADTFHGNSLWCNEKETFEFYQIFVVNERNGQSCRCDLCSCLSADVSPLPAAHARDKYKGCRPWNRYATNKIKLTRRVRSKLCLICVMNFRECRLGIYLCFRLLKSCVACCDE